MVGHQMGDELMENGRVRRMMGRLEDSQEERRKVEKRVLEWVIMPSSRGSS